MNRQIGSTLKVALILFFCGQANAQSVIEKDWLYEKKIHSLSGVVSCVASTTKAQSTLSVGAEIILPENDDKVPLIILKAKNLNGSRQRAYVRPDAKTQYPLLLLNSDAVTGVDTFVMSPMRMPETLKVIAEKTTLDVYFGEGATATLARISLMGSSKTINRSAACRTTKVLWKEALFTELKADAAQAAVVAGIVEDMMISYQQTLDLINIREQKQAALTAHLRTGQTLASQELAARQALAAAEKSVVDTQNQIVTLEKKVINLRNAIAKAQVDLPRLQSERPSAQSAVNSAQYSLQQVEMEIRRLENELSFARSRRAQAENVLSYTQTQVTDLQNQIYSLEQQANRIRQDQNLRRSELTRVNNRKIQLENEYRNFNVDQRIQQILRNDSSYASDKNLLATLNARRPQIQNEATAARNLVAELTRALKECKAKENPNPGPLVPGERPERPNDPSRPVRPEPVRDNCKAIEVRLQEAQRNSTQKEMELKEVDRKINDLTNSTRNKENNARQQANNERANIESELRRAQQSYNQLQSDITSADRQLNDIERIELPRKRSDLNNRSAELSNAQRNFSMAVSDERRAESNLNSYSYSSGYDRLQTDLRNAQNRLSTIDQGISNAQYTLREGPNQITQTETEIIRQRNLLVERQAAILPAQDRVYQANQQISAHQTLEVGVRADLTKASDDFFKSKRVTQGLSRGLYGY